MTATITPQHCAYPGCDQPPAPPGSDRGAKPKYCDDPAHNALSAHRERRKREAEASGQRAEETGGQPVTLGITRAAELVLTLEKLTPTTKPPPRSNTSSAEAAGLLRRMQPSIPLAPERGQVINSKGFKRR